MPANFSSWELSSCSCVFKKFEVLKSSTLNFFRYLATSSRSSLALNDHQQKSLDTPYEIPELYLPSAANSECASDSFASVILLLFVCVFVEVSVRM